MSAPSSQGPCICPPEGVMSNCPRCAFMWDYAGQNPFKDHLHAPVGQVLTEPQEGQQWS